MLRKLLDRFMDSLVGEMCPRCERLFKWSEARQWPVLMTTWGTTVRMCPDCYRREHQA